MKKKKKDFFLSCLYIARLNKISPACHLSQEDTGYKVIPQ